MPDNEENIINDSPEIPVAAGTGVELGIELNAEILRSFMNTLVTSSRREVWENSIASLGSTNFSIPSPLPPNHEDELNIQNLYHEGRILEEEDDEPTEPLRERLGDTNSNFNIRLSISESRFLMDNGLIPTNRNNASHVLSYLNPGDTVTFIVVSRNNIPVSRIVRDHEDVLISNQPISALEAAAVNRSFSNINKSSTKSKITSCIINGAQIKKDEKGNYLLLEENRFVSPNDTEVVVAIGAFLKNDPRLVPDCLHSKYMLVIDPKYMSRYIKVYTDIGNDGKLICNNTYTNTRKVNGSRSNECLPQVTNNGICSYILPSLLTNEIFKSNYTEYIADGMFYPSSDLKNIDNKKRMKIQYYKSKCDTFSFLDSIKNIPNTYVSTLGKKYTYGLEIETISGFMPYYLNKDLFYSAVHDGSLRDGDGHVYGGEYVTDILQGDLGLKMLKKLCYELTKRCLINRQCGVHVHLGGVTFNKENVVLMYWLYQKLQAEIFDMLPPSRRKNEYCRYLDAVDIDINTILSQREYHIDKYYNNIVKTLSRSSNGAGADINKKKDHPKGFKCGYDHSSARYCWVNFIPAIFDTRRTAQRIHNMEGHYTDPVLTIEFRPMSATTSYIKIKNWLLICFALVDIVENHKQDIYSGSIKSLTDVIKVCYPNNSLKLVDYIEQRKNKFCIPEGIAASSIVERNDYEDNEVDNNYSLKAL